MSDPRPASRTRRGITIGARILTTSFTGLLAVGAISLATGAIATRAAESPAPPPAPLPRIASSPISIEDSLTIARSFVGQIEAARRIDVAFETGGTVSDLLVAEGDTVTEGQVVARLDTRALEAERRASLAARDALAAQLELAMRTAERAAGLSASGFASDQRLDEAQLTVAELEARMAEIGAGIEAIDIALDKSILRAPFPGEVGARVADPGQTVAAGSPVLTLLESSAPELHVGLPPALAAGIEPSTRFEAVIDGQRVAAELHQLRPDLDPATRTQTAIFRLDTGGGALPFGQTARITLEQSIPERGAWVPLAALRAGLDGTWGVLTVRDGQIEAVAVELLHNEDQRVFVRGGFAEDARIVDSGAHRLVPGQVVASAE